MSGTGERLLDASTTVAAVGAAVTGGVLFGFSAFVMRALDRLPPERAIEAMQSMNREAPTVGFMTAMFGTAVVSAVLGVEGLRRLDQPDGRWLVSGAAAYLASVLVTAAFHVPRNDRLAGVVPAPADALAVWQRYSGAWTTGNHVRTALAIAAAVLFVRARTR